AVAISGATDGVAGRARRVPLAAWLRCTLPPFAAAAWHDAVAGAAGDAFTVSGSGYMRCRAGGGSLHEACVFPRKLFPGASSGPKRSLVLQGERHQYEAGERAQ